MLKFASFFLSAQRNTCQSKHSLNISHPPLYSPGTLADTIPSRHFSGHSFSFVNSLTATYNGAYSQLVVMLNVSQTWRPQDFCESPPTTKLLWTDELPRFGSTSFHCHSPYPSFTPLKADMVASLVEMLRLESTGYTSSVYIATFTHSVVSVTEELSLFGSNCPVMCGGIQPAL